MNPALERKLSLCLLVCVLAVNAVGLSAELSIGAVTGSDNISHWAIVQGMVRAVETGRNPLDFWSAEGSFGEPVVRTYQPLAHALVTLAYFGLGKSVPLMTVFLWVRYLAIVLLPIGFFAAARMIGFAPLAAAAASGLAPLISTAAFYGLDYSNYVSSGRGLFPQSVAAILLLLAIGTGYQAVLYGRRLALAGLLTGLTCVCHFIYGWMAAVTIGLLVLLSGENTRRRTRFGRVVAIGAVALVVSLFQILPVLIDRPILNHSHLEESWKWDSFGAALILRLLVTGELLDHDRLPVLSLLALAGVAWILWRAFRMRKLTSPDGFVLWGAVLWVLVFFGRATWGPLVLLLGATSDLHLHRVIGGVQIFLVLLAALGLVAACRELARRVHVVASILLIVVCLTIILRERSRYLAENERRGIQATSAYAAEQNVIDAVIDNTRQAGGRAYAGLGTTWGPRFNIAGIPFFAFLNTSLVPQTSASYNLLALTGDIVPSFDESRPAEYELFNVRTVIAPADLAANVPRFLIARESVGRFHIFDAPGRGYFDVVSAPASIAVSKENFYQVNERWLKSNWPEKKAHLWLDFRGEAPRELHRIGPDQSLADPIVTTPAGKISHEGQQGEIYSADIDMRRPGLVLFKMTWHPNWIAYLDSRPQKTAMLSPGFIGIPVPQGRHELRLSYEPGMWKLWMALIGLAAALVLVYFDTRIRRQGMAAPVANIQPAIQPDKRKQAMR